MDVPQSDAPFVKTFPRETTEAFLDGHLSAFAFFGGVLLSTLYDNTTIGVTGICGHGKRERTRPFTELHSHFCFRSASGGRARGTTRARSKGLVKDARSNFMTPSPKGRASTT